MADKKRVFVIEHVRTNLDINSARIFGEIAYVFDSDTRRCSVFQHNKFGCAILAKLEESNFDAARDSICVVGSMLTVSIALIVIAQKYSKFNILLFNSVHSKYVLKRIDINDWRQDGP